MLCKELSTVVYGAKHEKKSSHEFDTERIWGYGFNLGLIDSVNSDP